MGGISLSPLLDVVIPYQPGWGFQNTARQIQSHLPFTVKIIPYTIFPPPPSRILIFLWWDTYAWADVWKHLNRSKVKLVLCLFDHFTWKEAETNTEKLIRLGKRASFLLCANELLANQVKSEGIHPAPRLFEGGVDPELFPYNPRRPGQDEPIVIGWAGSTAYSHIKQLHILEHAVQRVEGIKLLTINRKENFIPFKEMYSRFYRNIHCIAVPSKSEGGPNPFLEAASTGLPYLANAVGIIPKFHREARGGILLPEANVQNFVTGLEALKRNRGKFEEWGQANRKEVMRAWTWKDRVKNLSVIIESLLRGKPLPEEVTPPKPPEEDEIGDDVFSLRRYEE